MCMLLVPDTKGSTSWLFLISNLDGAVSDVIAEDDCEQPILSARLLLFALDFCQSIQSIEQSVNAGCLQK